MENNKAVRMEGQEAIDYARENDLTLSKYADPTEDARTGLTVEEAQAVVREDPGLIYIDVDMPTEAQIIAAIEQGLTAGGVESDWEDPLFAEAVRLTGVAGCVWDFMGWEDTLHCLRYYHKLGGVVFAEAE